MRMRQGLGDSSAAIGAALGPIEGLFSPGAARARAELEAEHVRVLPVPSPGDRLLSEGLLVIDRACAGATPADDSGDAARRD